jgi:hypothetical protein
MAGEKIRITDDETDAVFVIQVLEGDHEDLGALIASDTNLLVERVFD